MTPCEKLGYKVGDRFVVKSNSTQFLKGQVIELIEDDGSTTPWFSNRGCEPRFLHLQKVKKLESTKETTMTKSNKYQFHSLSKADVDWNRIAQDLSSKNPLAFVDAGNGEQCVVVYDMFVDKAFECDILPPDTNYWHNGGSIFTTYRLEKSTFNDWVNWAREVKKAKWPVGRKAVVTVSLPKV